MADNSTSVHRLPWPVAAVVATALLTLGITSGQMVLSLVWCVAVAGSYVVQWRIVRGSPGFWTTMVVLLASVLVLMLLGDDKGANFIDTSALTGGELVAALIALQFWCWPPYGGERGVLPAALSGLVFLAGTWTREHQLIITITTPLYLTLLVLALRQVRERAIAFPYLALVVTLIFGGGTALEVRSYRNQISNWFMHLITPKGRNEATGISQSPILGATSDLRLSSARILKLSGPLPERHLRGVTFDVYGNGRWGPTVYGREFKPVPAPDLAPIAATQPNLEITRLVDDFRILVTPLHAAGIILPRRQIEWCPSFSGPLRTGLWLPPPLTYQIVLSDDECHQGPFCVKLVDDRIRERCLKLPADLDSRVRMLALQIIGSQSDPSQQVRMIVNYLRSHHTYSLTFDPGKGDPLTNFILADKGAHCEYFASAAVILLRCAGVPSRYVTGYYAHEAASDGTVTVRQRDAHAWAEAWLPDAGWITVDATPESGMPDVAGEPIPWWTSLTEWIQDKWAAFRAWAGDLSPMQQVEIVLAFSVFAIALQWLRVLRQKKKKMAVEIDYAIPDRALADLAERFERWLGEMQVPCPKNRTWGEHLSHLSHNPQVAREIDIGLVAEFVRRFASIRFGTPDDRAAIAALAVDFEKLTVRKN